MEIRKVNQLINNFNKQKIESKSKIEDRIKEPGISDNVEISSEADRMKALAMAQDVVADIKSSLVNTLAIEGITNKNDGFFNLLDTPIDNFVKSRFAELAPDIKKDFMDIFLSQSQVSGGLVDESIIKQTFGDIRGFGDMINQITQQLSRY